MRTLAAADREGLMAAMTYYVALAFKRSEENGEVVACDPKRGTQLRASDPDGWVLGDAGRTLRSHRVLPYRRSGSWRL